MQRLPSPGWVGQRNPVDCRLADFVDVPRLTRKCRDAIGNQHDSTGQRGAVDGEMITRGEGLASDPSQVCPVERRSQELNKLCDILSRKRVSTVNHL